MKTVGIIAEYNPFHNGHKYQIEKAKELTGADTVIVIMSGSFTQQGNIAIVDKFKRAEMAIKSGADLVIELPTIFATSSAEMFAWGAVNILDKLHSIDYLAFGTECNNIDVLNSIANKILDNNNTTDETIRNELQNGISYAAARDIAFKKILNTAEYIEFSKPNNILAIEYLKVLKTLNSKIKPLSIKREESNHNDNNINKESIFASATSIRNTLIENSNLSEIIKTIPKPTYDMLKTTPMTFNEDMFKLLRYKIIDIGKDNIKNINDVSEGLENKIYNEAINSKSYNELLNSIKSKRYTMSRIKRILVNILLDISKAKYENLKNTYYARILKVNKDTNILSVLNKNSSLPIISSVNDKKIHALSHKVNESLLLDFSSTNTYQIISNNNLNIDKTNML